MAKPPLRHSRRNRLHRGGLLTSLVLPGVVLAAAGIACGPKLTKVTVVEPAAPAVPPDWIHEQAFGVETPTVVRIVADPALGPEVATLFAGLDEILDSGAVLQDGTWLPIGWTTLRLDDREGVLVMSEPNYDDDPEHARRQDVSQSLRVLGAQWSLLNLVAQPLTPVNFDQHVLIGGDALTNASVFLMRVPSPGGRLSGWRLAPSSWDGSDELEVDSIPLYQLMHERPALMAALLLPAGTMAYFNDDAVSLVLDADDRVLYRAPEIPRGPQPEDSP
jgi:hypothetical protein